MLLGLRYKNLDVIGGGSVYTIDEDKGTKGLAFYYKVNGSDKKRKVVTGHSDEELREKAIKFLDKLESDCELVIMAAQVALAEASKPKVLTFCEVGEEWFKEYSAKRNDRKKPISYKSIESRRLSLNKINSIIGDMFITEVSQEVADSTVDKCSVKNDGTYYSKSYVGKLEQVLQLVVRYGRKMGYCDQVLDRVILDDNLPVPNPDDRFLDREQIEIIKKIVDNNPRYKIIVEVLSKTGLRQEELFALETTDFTVQKNNRVAVKIDKTVVEEENNEYNCIPRVKTYKSKRTIYVGYDLYEKIMEYHNFVLSEEGEYERALRELNETEDVIFVNKDKQYNNKKTFRRSFKLYLKRNGGKDYDFNATLHMFRHSYASLMAEKAPVEKVAKMLGDSQQTVYNNYYSLTEKDKDDIVDYTDEIYEGIF